MKDTDGKVIYIGKAVNLRNRLRPISTASAQQNIRTPPYGTPHCSYRMIVVGSELEALILEMNLTQETSAPITMSV